jgi:PAS domain S-box-containing protein
VQRWRQEAAVNRAVSWIGDSRWRTYVVCLLAAALPLAAMGYSIAEMLKVQVERRSHQETAQAAGLLSALVTNHFEQQVVFLESYAHREELRQAWARRDLAEVTRHLRDAGELRPDVEHFSLNDLDGTLRAVYPPDAEVLGRNFAFRSWYKEVSRDWRPHVSEAFQSVMGSRKLAVVVAVPVRDEGGGPIGILVGHYPVDKLQAHMGSFLGEGPSRLTVVDSKGQVVLSPDVETEGELVSLAAYPAAQYAVDGSPGTGTFARGGREYIAAHAPIAGLGWGVIAEQPLEEVRGQMRAAELQVGGFTLFFLAFATVAGGTLASVYRNLRQVSGQVRDLYDNAPCGYHSLDANGVFVQVNSTELSWLGHSREETVGKLSFLEVIDEGSAETFRKNFPLLKERGSVRELEFRMVRKDGTSFPALLSATAVRDAAGRFLMSRSTVFDISDHKRVAVALQESERGCRVLSLELEQRNQELQRATQMKSQFLANMSHELRTPLNAIMGFSELLELRIPGPLTEKQEHYVRHIRQGGKHLLQLVNDILDLSKIEAGKVQLRLEDFAPADVLPEVLSIIRPLAMEKGVKVVPLLQGAPPIRADRVRFKQVLYNLLSNAVKFTSKGGQVSVGMETQGSFLAISVRDTGVGIGKEDQAVIFEEFRQAGLPTSGATEGTGLGLAISRRIVEQHGGCIRVESEPGKGSCFTFTMSLAEAEPVAVVAPATPARAPRPAGGGSWPLVLVVDDDPATCDLLADWVELQGYRVAKAHSGKEALQKARLLQPAVITLDILMPEGSGLGVLFTLRNTPETAKIPVVVVSVVDQVELGLAVGAADYLQKPVDRSRLLQMVEEHVGCPEQHPTVLVVDNDPEVLLFVSDILEAQGYTVHVAASGREALHILDSTNVHGILLDLVMPGMDGFEVLRLLKERPAMRDVPVFVLTAKDLSEREMEELRRESHALLLKTGSWKRELLAQLRRHVAAAGVRLADAS